MILHSSKCDYLHRYEHITDAVLTMLRNTEIALETIDVQIEYLPMPATNETT